MLGVFYAYIEEYKHNDCFLSQGKPLQYIQNKTSWNFKISVTAYIIFAVKWMLLFFNIFINYFPKIYHSILQGISPTLIYWPHSFFPCPPSPSSKKNWICQSAPFFWATPLKSLGNWTPPWSVCSSKNVKKWERRPLKNRLLGILFMLSS